VHESASIPTSFRCSKTCGFLPPSGAFSRRFRLVFGVDLGAETDAKKHRFGVHFRRVFDVISGGAAKLPRSKSFPIAETGLLHLSHNVYYGKYEKDEKIASDGARFPVRKTRLRKGRLGADFRASQGHSRVPVSNGFPVRFRRSPGVGNAASGGRKNDAFSAH
jgi:hypothetical protein